MDLPEWYDENRTVAEMAQISGKKRNTIEHFLLRHKLKYKPVIENIPKWYDPNSTIREMAEKSGKSRKGIFDALKRRNLKCMPEKALDKIPEWYDANLSISDMSIRANKPRSTISMILRRLDLPYKRKIVVVNSLIKKYSKDDFMQYYNENLTVREISLLSKIPEQNVRNFLNHYHLKYFKIINDLIVGEWYSPNKTIEEMSFESGLSNHNLYNLLYRRKLPFANKKKNTVVTSL